MAGEHIMADLTVMEPCVVCEFGFSYDPGTVRITGGVHTAERRTEDGRVIIKVTSKTGKSERWKAKPTRGRGP